MQVSSGLNLMNSELSVSVFIVNIGRKTVYFLKNLLYSQSIQCKELVAELQEYHFPGAVDVLTSLIAILELGILL